MRLLLSVVFPLVVAGLRGLDSFDLKPNDDTLLAQFGFEANGKMAANFSVEIPKNYDGHVVTLGCYMDDWSKADITVEDICNVSTSVSEFVIWSKVLTPALPNGTVIASVSRPGTVYVVAVDCGRSSITLDMSYHFVNPGGEELSSTQVPLKTATFGFVLAWSAVGIGWIANRFRNSHLSSGMHTTLGLLPFLAAFANLAENRLWMNLSKTGELDTKLVVADVITGASFETAMMFSFMAISAGWCISRLTLSTSEWRLMGADLVFFFMASSGWEMMANYAFAFLIIAAFFLIIGWIAKNSKMNVEMLYMRLNMVMETVNEDMSTRLMTQFDILRKFRSAVITYLCFVILSGVWGSLGMQRAPWAVYCMEEGMTLSMIAYLIWILRLSRNNLYCATLEANLSLLGHNALNGADIVGTVGEEAVQPPVIVVSNPSSVDSSGHLVRDLMVATPVMQWGTVCAPPATPSQPPAPSTTAAVVSTGPRSPGSPLVDIQLDENEDARLLARSV